MKDLTAIIIKMKNLLLIWALFLGTQCYAQKPKAKSHFPIWSFNQQDVNIFGISTGLFSVVKKESNAQTNGLRLELIGLGLFLPFAPQSLIAENQNDIEAIEKSTKEKVNGISLCPLGSISTCQVNGISIGGIGQYQYKINGLSASIFRWR